MTDKEAMDFIRRECQYSSTVVIKQQSNRHVLIYEVLVVFEGATNRMEVQHRRAECLCQTVNEGLLRTKRYIDDYRRKNSQWFSERKKELLHG